MSSYRSSSHVSVYNYPEHLNPFYEDEQHKRLRFWKIKKSNASNKSNKNENSSSGMRRGSFNFGSLRDLLWVWKCVFISWLTFTVLSIYGDNDFYENKKIKQTNCTLVFIHLTRSLLYLSFCGYITLEFKTLSGAFTDCF